MGHSMPYTHELGCSDGFPLSCVVVGHGLASVQASGRSLPIIFSACQWRSRSIASLGAKTCSKGLLCRWEAHRRPYSPGMGHGKDHETSKQKWICSDIS